MIIMDIKRLIEIRAQRKRRKPNFIRQDSHKLPSLKKSWRMPKGHQSKIRRGINGHRPLPAVGFGSPAKIRHFHRSGKRVKVIHCMKDMETLTPDTFVIVMSGSLGRRKRIEILKKAVEKKFTVLNEKNPAEYIKNIEDGMKRGKEEKAKKQEEKKERKKQLEKEAEKKKKEKESIEQAVSEEDKKIQDKKQMDEQLIHTE